MGMKKVIFIGAVFVVSFLILNLTPLIPIEYSSGEEKVCTLNYFSCLHTVYEDNFPNFLKSGLWAVFILPIFLPALISYCFYRLKK